MRGPDYNQSAMFSYLSAEERVPAGHPLRPIRSMCDRAMQRLSPKFEALYSEMGRPSIAPEMLMRALLLQVLFSIPNEELLMEQLNYNLLYRWFVGLNMDEQVWHYTTFSKNRDRLLKGEVAQAFFDAVLAQAREQELLSDQHFTVDGTLIEAWASKKSYQKKEEPPEQGSGARGKMLLRDTHESKTDPDARLYRKNAGGEFQLCHMAHVLMENRHALPVAGQVTEARTDAEWDAALEMLAHCGCKGATVGGDKGFDYPRFVQGARELGVTPHVAQHTQRSSSIDARTTRHESYRISLAKRKSIEQIFGWIKRRSLLRKVHLRGRELVQWMFLLGLTAYNLIRIRNLMVESVKV